jgi:Family of unknown function (DUF5682)
MPSKPLARLFGVRHLSPMAALHLLAELDALRPTAVLIEGPADATERMTRLVHQRTRPPVALLAYTKQRPVRSFLYPLAAYSPEWIALNWAVKHHVELRFMDLPAEATLAQLGEVSEKSGDTKEPGDPDAAPEQPTHAPPFDPWREIARLSGEVDYETWWERNFEHTTDPDSYFRQINELGHGLRELTPGGRPARDLLREAHMRRCIRDVLQSHPADRVAVVCGAMHVPALTDDLPALTDDQLTALPRVETLLTLMPYSYPRLSAQSGYGAGNHAPLYFQRLYEQAKAGKRDELPSQWLSELTHAMRQAGHIRSPADVIEAVRLAQALAILNAGPAPTLGDLRDAAATCLGLGDPERVRPHLAALEIGHQVGRLPPDVGQTALQEDFEFQLDRLRLTDYKKDLDQKLELDLRESHEAVTPEEALRDRNRSAFLHRLLLTRIPFGAPIAREEVAASATTGMAWNPESEADLLRVQRDTHGTAHELWRLHWVPECEVQLAETSMNGDTVEAVAGQKLLDGVAECDSLAAVSGVVRQAVLCQLPDSLGLARERLQALAVEHSSLPDLAGAVGCIGDVIRYGSVRKVDPEPFRPLLFQLFLRGTLQLEADCHCHADAAADMRQAITTLDDSSTQHAADVDAARWKEQLDQVARSDTVQPYLAGFVTALLLAQGRFPEDDLAREVNRRLSPATDLAASMAWLEGILAGNRQALFTRLVLWRQLDHFLVGLDDETFQRALVPLRRTFGEFSVAEVRRVIDNLAEIDRGAARQLAAVVDIPLGDEEIKEWNARLEGLEFES